MKFAEIAVNVPVNQTFHYHVPLELEGKIEPGQLVRVAFRTAMQPGIVVALSDESPVKQTKPILERIDPLPVVKPQDIALAYWLSERYLAPLSQCLWLMLPPGMAGKRDELVTLVDPDAQSDDPLQRKIIGLLRGRGTLRGDQIHRSVKTKKWKPAVRALAEAGIVARESVLAPPVVKPLVVEMAALAIHPDRIPDTRRHLGRPNRLSNALEAILTAIDESGELPTVMEVLELPGIGEATLDKLLESGAVSLENGTHVCPVEDRDQALFQLRQGEVDLHVLLVLARENRPVDVSWVYAQTGATRENLTRLAEQELVRLGSKRAWRDSLAERDFVPRSAPRLTPGQRAVWQVIRAALDSLSASFVYGEGELSGERPPDSATPPPSPGAVGRKARRPAIFLLHGVTGSGKTEIYLRAIGKVVAQGRQAVFLVPEIALTAQTVRRVMARFPGRVAVLGEEDEEEDHPGRLALVHGKLKPGERYDTWCRARAREIDIVIGTRSALFTPLPDVGLVILDEEHDHSYKQSPPTLRPQVYYHTRDVAERMMRENGGTLILGGATPDVETYFRAQRGEIAYLSLPDRIVGHRIAINEQAAREGIKTRYADEQDQSDALTMPLPPVEVVDMRAELKVGNTGIFSRALRGALGETLSRGEQAILFLNRRGTSIYVFCRDCGYVVTCPRCDLPLTYHTYSDKLHCHHCNYRAENPTTCPECCSKRIKFFGAGTQQVEAALRTHFPAAIGLRWDADTTPKPETHDIILQRFMKRQAQVLIGTQMIAKGLDLPLVTLVGVVSADVGLFLPDFRAGERTFQLLTQVAGRAGRGLLGGKVILQTYQPEHYAVAAAETHDYAGFYAQEIAYRREMGYPPFRRLVRVLFRHESERRARDGAQSMAEVLRDRLERLGMTGTEMIGPAPCYFTRVNRLHRWHILLRGPNPALAFQSHPEAGLAALDIPQGGYVDVDPVNVL